MNNRYSPITYHCFLEILTAIKSLILISAMMVFAGCAGLVNSNSSYNHSVNKNTISCCSNVPSRISTTSVDTLKASKEGASHVGMVWISGGEFLMGSSDKEGSPDDNSYS